MERLDRLNAWLMLAANAGVLVGVIFLVVEINQNTRALNVQNIWNANAIANELNALLAQDDDLRLAFQAALNDPDSVSEEDLFKAHFAVRMYFNFFMSQYWTKEEFGMPDTRWEGFIATFSDFANTPGGRRFLEENAGTFTGLSPFLKPGDTRQFSGFGLSEVPVKDEKEEKDEKDK